MAGSVFAPEFRDFGPGRFAPPGSLSPGALLARMRHYKRTIAKRYRIVTPDAIADVLREGNFHTTTKIDGELWFCVKLSGEVALCAPNGRVLQGLPLVDEAAELLRDCGDIVLAGELFAVSREGRPRVHHVAVALRDPARAATLGFKAFDLVAEGDEDWLPRPWTDRLDRMREVLAGGKRVALVTVQEGSTDAILDCWDKWVESKKFEGLVVHNETGFTYKIKPTITVDAVVLGFGERRTDTQREVRELIIGLLRDDGSFHVLGTVAGGLSEADRLTWFRRLDAMVVPCEFRMANSEGTLCRFVEPKIVVQVRCSDLLEADTRDAPVRRMTLGYDHDRGWRPLGVMPILSLIHPVFEGERTDKPVDSAHVGLDQVYAYLPFEGREEAPLEQNRTPSELLERRVWTKAARGGGVAIRKLVTVQTHKDREDPSWPPFAAHFTDWSAGRKDPLKTTVATASSREAIDARVAAWMDKNIKKGWDEVGAAQV